MSLTHPRIEAARAGTNPATIYRLDSGWVFLCDLQFLPGYCIFTADPVVASLNDLDEASRSRYLADMALVGDVLMEVTGAYRINYFIGGNTDPILHAHIIPRYLSEPDQYRTNLPWWYPDVHAEATAFNLERDRPLMQAIAAALKKRQS